MLDREQLETFFTVIKHGGFDRAATALNISRGAVSQRIKALEDSLATILVVRDKPVVATQKGEILIRHVKTLRLLEDDTFSTIQTKANGRQPVPVAIAINGDSMATWFGPVIWELLDRHRIALEVIEDDQNHTFERLRRGEVMGCISSEGTAMPSFTATSLGVMPYRCVATPDFVRRHFSEGLTLTSACAAPAILFDRKDSLHETFLEKLFNVKGMQCFRHYIPSPVSLLDAILNGAGYGLVSCLQTKSLLASGRLLEIAPRSSITMPLYWHHWKLELPLACEVTRVITTHAHQVLDQA